MSNVNYLRAKCQESQQQRIDNSSSCFALFTLALVDDDQQAWEAIVDEFSSMVKSWVYRNERFNLTQEPPEFFVNAGFTRLWKSGSRRAKNGDFNKTSDYLGYLKQCTWSSIEDHLRSRAKDAGWYSQQIDDLHLYSDGTDIADRLLAERVAEEMWKVIGDNPDETIVAEEVWVRGLKPRDIVQKYPEQFDSVKAVYKARKNLIRRMKRHPMILEYIASTT